MRQGKLTRPLGTVSANPKLVFLHGYCSSSNPWQPDSHIFTDAAYFLNPDANINNEAFSQKVAAYIQAQGITSFGLV
jgi:pimeloyl-ACP methyl ester carboxylesterase